MSSMPASLRVLAVYLVCIPLALFIGYQLANPFTYDSVFTVGIVLLVLMIPVMLKWHRQILLFSFGSNAVIFFLYGRPRLALVMVGISLLISILQRTLQYRFRFIRAPEITWPLVAVMVVVVATMFLRGGVGFRFMGSSNVGSSRYVMLLLGLFSYFAITAQPIPRERVNFYIGLFFLGGITSIVGDFFSIATPSYNLIFLVFPPSALARTDEINLTALSATRLFGLALMAGTIYRFMLARYGLRGLFYGRTRLRLVIFLFFTALSGLGGFRSFIIGLMLQFGVMFYLEGLHRTRLLILVLVSGVLAFVLMVAFLPQMPITVQRALAFLPLEIDPAARISAEASSEWRLAMWKSVWPEVPNYLLLGKGLGFSETDFEAITNADLSARSPDQWMWAVITGDFHNGPLSVVLTFGIWGLIAFIWLHIAGLRALYLNYKHGAPELRTINTFMLTVYFSQMILFWFVFGSMYSETIIFASLLGFSVALNNGVLRAPEKAPEAEAPEHSPAPVTGARLPNLVPQSRHRRE